MNKFFSDQDFDIFSEQYATSDEDEVIQKRKIVFEKFRDLHENHLKEFCRYLDLHPHHQPQHLTNVYYPFKEANGGYVDYMRLGYGKEHRQILNMYRKIGFSREDMAFYKVVQLQTYINEDGFGVDLYLDKSDVIEHANIAKKISTPLYYNKIASMIDELADKYIPILLIYERYEPHQSKYKPVYINSGKDFLDKYMYLYNSKQMFSVIVDIQLDRNDEINDIRLYPKFVMKAFIELYPLYKELSWSITNNYL